MKLQAQPILSKSVDNLRVQVYADRLSLGEAAASQTAAVIRDLLASAILRLHPSCRLYVDTDSYEEMPDERVDDHGIG
jgi:hypothetical protein